MNNEAKTMNDVTSGRTARGGKSIYGACVGVLMLDTDFPRIPGDIGNGLTWPFPVLFRVVRGATSQRAVDSRDPDSLQAFIAAGKDLVADGADGLATSCGFLTRYQDELAAGCGVPVAASSLMQVPMVERLLPPGKRVGILTINSTILAPDLLEMVGIAPDTPIMGCEAGPEFSKFTRRGDQFVDCVQAEQDMLDAGAELVRRHPEVGAIVLECTNMPPYAAALSAHVGMPVYSIYSFLTWFQAGLSPRRFGPQAAPTRGLSARGWVGRVILMVMPERNPALNIGRNHGRSGQ